MYRASHRQEDQDRTPGAHPCRQDGRRLETAGAGDIAGLFGIDCHSGETFVGEGPRLAMTSMHVPDPVISLSVTPVRFQSPGQHVQGAAALHQRRSDLPRPSSTSESGETIVSGMGELHLEVYIERMRREYNRRGRDRRPPGSLSRGDFPPGGVRLRAQEADRRFRPVRQGRWLYRSSSRRAITSSSMRSAGVASRRSLFRRATRASAARWIAVA